MSLRHTRSVTSARAWPLALIAVSVFLATCALPELGIYHAYFDPVSYTNQMRQLADGLIPYRDLFFEYPPGALVSFAVPALASEGYRDDVFRLLQMLFGCIALIALAVILSRTAISPRRAVIVCVVAGAVPGLLGPVSIARFDLQPAMLVAVAVALLVCDRYTLGLAALGLAISTKLYPLLLVPVVLLYVVSRGGRRRAMYAGIASMTVAAAVFAPFLVVAENGVVNSLLTQRNRPLQIESVGATILLLARATGTYSAQVAPDFGSWNLVGDTADLVALVSSIGLVAFSAAVALLFARSPREPRDLVLALATTLAGALVFGKVFSPQYLLWLWPLVLAAAAKRRAIAIAAVFVSAVLLTHAFYPADYEDGILVLRPFPIAVLVVRNLSVVALAVLLAHALTRRARLHLGFGTRRSFLDRRGSAGPPTGTGTG
jgi:uncharacterized membrane protein